MQVTVEDQSSVKKILHIEVSEHDVNRELNDAYNKLKKTAKIKGFRPGKVPRSVLEGMFKKDVHADVTSKLIQSSFVEAIEETKINILGHPKVDPPQLDKKGPYKYDAAVEVRPEMDDIEFKGLSLTKILYKAGEDEVDGQIKMLRKNQAVLEPIKEDRPAKEGDAAIVDYEAFKDGQPIDDMPNAEGRTMGIGKGFISKDFDQQLIGMKPGDKKEFEIHMPGDYFKKSLADLDISFTVTLKEIKEEILPELDDKFAKSFGQFESLDALKGEIEKNLKQGYDKRIEHELNEQIFTALIEKTDFELPDTLVDFELDMIIADAQKSFAQSNISMEQLGLTEETLSEKYRDTAEKQARRHLILGKIIQQEDMDVSQEEIDEGFKEITELYSQPIEEIKKFYQENPDKLEVFKHALLEKKAILLIIKHGSIEEKEPEPEPEQKPEENTE